MRIAHLSDTHLGYAGSGIQTLVEDPWRPGTRVRQQEADGLNGVARAIDRILEAPLPDLVLHTGDLFDRALPSPATLDFAMAQFRRLSDAEIPVVLVEGDHSCPRSREQGHVLRLLLHLPGVRVVWGEPQAVRLGCLTLYAYPHRALAQGSFPDPERLEPSPLQVLACHGVADGLGFYKTHRLAASVPIQALASHYDYVALGHSHHFSQVPGTDRAFYAGSTALAASGDFRPGYEFGFNLVELNGGCPKVRRQSVLTRPMQAYGLDDAAGLTAEQTLEALACQAEAVPPPGAVCRVVVEGLDPLARRNLSVRAVEELFGSAAVLTLSLRVREPRWETVRAGLSTGDPASRFTQLLARSDGAPEFKEAVQGLGQELLERAAERVGAEDLEITDREETEVE